MASPSIITIGNFDGVHLGHQAIVQVARQLAEPKGARVLALTFDPFPITILRPEQAPPQVASIAQRVESLKQAGADDVIVVKPSREVLSQEAPQFIASLIAQHKAVGFVEGEDFRFGKKRGGDMSMLASMGADQGFAVRALPRVETPLSDHSVAPISSSLVRWLIGRGRVEDAGACLGRPFELVGQVVKGEQRGRLIGVPTANLDPDACAGLITPMDGVYAGNVTIDDSQTYPAAISVGLKPTFGHDQLTIEGHLIGYAPDDPDGLYGHQARFTFAHWLRDQYSFPGVDALKEQLGRDIETARATMADQTHAYD